MKLIDLLIIIGLLFLFISNEKVTKTLDIKEGIYYYKKIKNEIFQFTAINNGYYLITFNYTGCILEAIGNIPQDFYIDKKENKGWLTSAYAQKFTEGDYFIMNFPYNALIKSNYYIKIERINLDINFRFFHNKDYFIENLYFNNCLKPTFIFIRNPYDDSYNNDNIFYFKSIIHSGEFSAKYRDIDYSPTNNEKPLNDNFKEFNLNYLTILPNKLFFNIIELKCKKPGVITLIYSASDPVETSSEFTTHALDSEGIIQNRYNFSHDIFFSADKGTYFFEFYNIYGCAKFNMTPIGEKIYDCTDFYFSKTFKNAGYYKIPMTILNKPFWFFSVVRQSIQQDTVIIKEESTIYKSSTPGSKFIIPINSNIPKKFIKIKCSIPKFFWTLEFTQKNISYLPYPYGSKPKYFHDINDSALYIRNPYSFEEIKTNYYWFIILYHYDKEALPKFYYTNEDNETEIMEPENDLLPFEEEEKEEKNNSKKSFSWIPFLLLVIIISLFIFFVIRFIRKPKENIENILKEMEMGQLTEE